MAKAEPSAPPTGGIVIADRATLEARLESVHAPSDAPRRPRVLLPDGTEYRPEEGVELVIVSGDLPQSVQEAKVREAEQHKGCRFMRTTDGSLVRLAVEGRVLPCYVATRLTAARYKMRMALRKGT